MSYRDETRTGAWRHAAAVAAVIAALLSAPIPSALATTTRAALPVPALDSPEALGVNTGVMFNSGKYTRTQINAQLTALAQTGTTEVRSDALWEDSEPQPPIAILHRYNWTLDDEVVSSLAAHGLRWLPIIDYSAPWAKAASAKLHSPPSSSSDYAAFAAAVASRYGPGGSFWLENPGLKPVPVLTYEIWNEPDNPVFWSPTPSPSAYANLYSAARSAILAKQSGARVIIGGLTRPAWFLGAMLTADPGLRGQIDGVAIHPYGSTPDRVFMGVRSARLAMRADGLADTPLYVTEVGWTTHGSSSRDSATAAQRPAYISSTISTLGHTDCGIAGVFLYAWTTPERNPANPQDWFGISPPGGGGTRDPAAFAAALAAAQAPAPPALLCTTDMALVDSRVRPFTSPSGVRTRHSATRARRRRCRRSAARRARCRRARRPASS